MADSPTVHQESQPFPQLSTPMVDPGSGLLDRAWYRLIISFWQKLGGKFSGQNDSVFVQQTGPASAVLRNSLTGEQIGEAGGLSPPSGFVKVKSGNIAPSSFLDISLPPEYLSFKLEISAVFFNVHGSLTLAISLDAGATFINDSTNFDSYQVVGSSVGNAGFIGANAFFVDSVMILTGRIDTSSPFGGMTQVDIFPGSPDLLFQIFMRSFNEHSGTYVMADQWGGINPAATIPPSKGRATTLRILPYGNGDVNPPTSTDALASGKYVLWGILP